MTHAFLFEKGIWLGMGTIQLGTAPSPLKMHTRWTIDEKTIKQEVEIIGVHEKLVNQYRIQQKTPKEFTIFLSNATVQNVEGKGLISDSAINWTFDTKELTGFENFDLQSDGTYLFQAEFGTIGEFCNQIEGKIWRSGSS